MSGVLQKRSREEETPLDSVKRFHGDTEEQALCLFEEIECADKLHQEEECGHSEEVVSRVMRSLEEEIGITSCSTSYETSGGSLRDGSVASDVTSRYEIQRPDDGEIDLEYLLEASDDELGIPPTPLQNLEKRTLSSPPSEHEDFRLSFDFAEYAELEGSVDNWHYYEDDFVNYTQFDTPAFHIVSEGASIDGNS